MGLLQLPVEHNQTFFNLVGLSFISQQGFGGLQEEGDGSLTGYVLLQSNDCSAMAFSQ